MGLAIAAVIAASFLGVLSWTAQKFSANKTSAAVPLRSEIEFIDENVRNILDSIANAEIEKAKEAASVADERAANATKEAGRANEAASVLKERAARLERDAESERTQNLQTAKSLEDEKVKRLALAVGLLPRVISDSSGIRNRMRPFTGRTAVFEYLDEHEVIAMAEQINGCLFDLGWTIHRRRGREAGIPDGISIGFGSQPISIPAMATAEFRASVRTEENLSREAGRTLAEELIKQGIDVEPIRLGDRNLPTTTLVIRVGSKPNKALEETLRELGPAPPATPITGTGVRISALRIAIPEEPPPPPK
jgi:hypothetical protein